MSSYPLLSFLVSVYRTFNSTNSCPLFAYSLMWDLDFSWLEHQFRTTSLRWSVPTLLLNLVCNMCTLTQLYSLLSFVAPKLSPLGKMERFLTSFSDVKGGHTNLTQFLISWANFFSRWWSCEIITFCARAISSEENKEWGRYLVHLQTCSTHI